MCIRDRFAKLTPGEAHFYNLDGDEIEKQTTEIKWDAEAAEKGGFEHFMMKEIHEQPKAVQDTLNSVIKNGIIDLSSVEIIEDEIKNFEQIYIVACGSAWHVGMAAQYVLEDMADIPVRVELASEFRYRKMPLNQKALVIVVSQSGETADTLAALRLAKEKGITTMAIVNVVGSSIAREADKVFYTLAGPEISVATTKAYSAQLAAMYCLAVQFTKVRGKITDEQYSYYISELQTIPEKIQKILEEFSDRSHRVILPLILIDSLNYTPSSPPAQARDGRKFWGSLAAGRREKIIPRFFRKGLLFVRISDILGIRAK